jgi:hypothetical protein
VSHFPGRHRADIEVASHLRDLMLRFGVYLALTGLQGGLGASLHTETNARGNRRVFRDRAGNGSAAHASDSRRALIHQ